MNENHVQCVNENQQTPVVGRTPGVWNSFEINDTHKHPVSRSLNNRGFRSAAISSTV